MIHLRIPARRLPFISAGRHVAGRGRRMAAPVIDDRTVMFPRPAVDPWPTAPLCHCGWCRSQSATINAWKGSR